MGKTGLVALVTGATSGIGRAITKRLIADGMFVVGLARRTQLLEELTIEHAGRFQGLVADVADREAVHTALQSLDADARAIDVLVNNAGLALGLEPAQSARLDDWEAMIDANCRGLVTMTHAVLPDMVRRNSGHVVNIGSAAGEWPYAGGNVYGATKAFAHQFSLNLRADLAGTAVRVTCVEPGMVGDTEFSKTRFRGDEQKAEQVYADTEPLTPDDIADAVSWVVSRPARVNVNVMQIMPVVQSFARLSIHRNNKP